MPGEAEGLASTATSTGARRYHICATYALQCYDNLQTQHRYILEYLDRDRQWPRKAQLHYRIEQRKQWASERAFFLSVFSLGDADLRLQVEKFTRHMTKLLYQSFLIAVTFLSWLIPFSNKIFRTALIEV
jgi:hypothetical protein